MRLFSDHPVRLYDKSDAPGTAAHPFGHFELFADATGLGSGERIAAASMALSDEDLRMESAGTPVIKLIEVTTHRPPAPLAKP